DSSLTRSLQTLLLRSRSLQDGTCPFSSANPAFRRTKRFGRIVGSEVIALALWCATPALRQGPGAAAAENNLRTTPPNTVLHEDRRHRKKPLESILRHTWSNQRVGGSSPPGSSKVHWEFRVELRIVVSPPKRKRNRNLSPVTGVVVRSPSPAIP